MRHFVRRSILSSLITLVLIVVPATATVVTFEDQAASRGGDLTGIPDSPLTIGIATFSGGELLNAEVGLPSDQTGVYASQGLFGSGETNPVTITFASPVSGFSILIANGDDVRSYTVSDDLGDTTTMSLSSTGSLGVGTFSLSGNGLTSVSIISANVDAWDFAIDDVTFTPATAAPEPQSLLLIGVGLVLLLAVHGMRRILRSRRLSFSPDSDLTDRD